MHDLVPAIVSTVDSEIDLAMGDGQPVTFKHAEILSVDTANQRAKCLDDTLVVRWLPYWKPASTFQPIPGETWRIIEFGGTALLEDWAPHSDLDFTEIILALPLLGYAAPTLGMQTSGQTTIGGTVLNIADELILTAQAVLELMVTDGPTDGEPSATATLGAGAIGTLLAGSGTATAYLRVGVNSDFEVILSSPAATRYLWIRQGPASPVWIRHQAGPLAVPVLS